MSNKRRVKDGILKGITYFASFFSIAALLLIIGFVFLNGFKLLNWDLITHNYEAVSHIADLKEGSVPGIYEPTKTLDEDVYYSTKWGLGLKDDINLQGKTVVVVSYVHPDSPFMMLNNKGVGEEDLYLSTDFEIIRIAFEDA